jgi:thymidylate synthase (FAD)
MKEKIMIKPAMLRIIKPHIELTTSEINPAWVHQALELIEICGRVSHKSEGRIKPGSAVPFIRKVAIEWGHESILEHACFTACFVGSRTMSHQLVRHRIGSSYTQESQRYCDYSNKKYGAALGIIIPSSIGDLPHNCLVDEILDFYTSGGDLEGSVDRFSNLGLFLLNTLEDYKTYLSLRDRGIPAEDAREALPNACKTEVYTTFNIRQWRHFFSMRLDKHAQWQIKMLAQTVFDYFKETVPLFVENLDSHSGDKL